MPLNLLLWGDENWSDNQEHIAKCEVLQNKAITRMIGTSMKQVKDKEITNADIRRRFSKIPKVEDL